MRRSRYCNRRAGEKLQLQQHHHLLTILGTSEYVATGRASAKGARPFVSYSTREIGKPMAGLTTPDSLAIALCQWSSNLTLSAGQARRAISGPSRSLSG